MTASSQDPDTDDTGHVAASPDRTVVDDGEPAAIGPDAFNAPVGVPFIGLAVLVQVADGLFYLMGRQTSLGKTQLGVIGPDEAGNRHGAGG